MKLWRVDDQWNNVYVVLAKTEEDALDMAKSEYRATWDTMTEEEHIEHEGYILAEVLTDRFDHPWCAALFD